MSDKFFWSLVLILMGIIVIEVVLITTKARNWALAKMLRRESVEKMESLNER